MHLINRPFGFRTVIGNDVSLGSIPDRPKWHFLKTKAYAEWHRFECPKCDVEHYRKLRQIQIINRKGGDPGICISCWATDIKTSKNEVHAACVALALRKKAMGLIK